MIKLHADFLGPYFVEDAQVVRPMAKVGLKLASDLWSERSSTGDAYLVTDMNDEQEIWYPTMKDIIYLEAQRFLKTPDFERFVCLATAPLYFGLGSDAYPRITSLFPNGYAQASADMRAHLSLASVIERSYYRRLAQNHFKKARAVRDGQAPQYGISTDLITRRG